ncbi:DUF3293 domain-containing protein [uncultured Shewanella sp.]|uniref:DUF3293 domain-containing protein n=1 Tax=uncultured Shewanella sp. TaxID=173975 RepID=UPI002608AC23|nr:DUF3293 domain-containing protein [uncultured Shewanella sp.]
MNNLVDDLWQCYQETEFLLTQALSSQLSFAIITAHNPKGMILSPSQNRLLDKKLQNELVHLGALHQEMIGTSVDMSHREKSWAVAVERKVGIAIGLKFKQNAIYYVETDKLRLIPCLFQKQEICLGSFSKKMKLVSELPQ